MSLVQTIRDYVPIEMLGRGGFGVTYLVTDKAPHRNNRQCVLKQFKPAQILNADLFRDMQRRFSVEAKALQVLGQQSDQIPKLFDEFSENNEFYLVQEYVEGKTLVKKVEQERQLSETEVRRILSYLLPVIQQVHNNKMIHRDITPDNIMLRNKDSKPILIDFGAVKEVLYTIVDSKGDPLDVSIAIGKNSYMPNEQKLGLPRYESDLYSVGLTAVYLLTGKSPGEFTRNPETMTLEWSRHAGGIGNQLRAVLEKATQVDYKDRYRSAAEMLRDLENTTTSSTVTFVKTFTPEETRRRQTEWQRICAEIERRQREAWQAVRLYNEQLEGEFQKDLKKRIDEEAKRKAQVRLEREKRETTGKKAEQQTSHSKNQTQPDSVPQSPEKGPLTNETGAAKDSATILKWVVGAVIFVLVFSKLLRWW